MQVLHSLLAFIVAISILVTIHEFGHFWVARKVGVKILRFSIGFGRPLWCHRFGPDQTEFVIAALPLGGYVRMLDEREAEVDAEDAHRAFNRQSLPKRAAVVLAGPLANFLFAIVAYAAMYSVGVVDLKPIVGEVVAGSVASKAGFEAGQQIVAVDGQSTPTWTTVLEGSLADIIEAEPVVMRVRASGGAERNLHLPAAALTIDDVTEGRFFSKLGLHQYRPDYQPVVREVIPGGAAERAGLKVDDIVRAASGKPVKNVEDLIGDIEAHPGTAIALEVVRDGRPMTLEVTPEPVQVNGKTVGKIKAALGVPPSVGESLRAVERYAPPQALLHGIAKAWQSSRLTVLMFGKMLIHQASVDNISGPISIAQYAGQSASLGLAPYLAFLAIVSVSLFVLNMLPIPLLDGGHLMYYLMEFAIGKPVPESIQVVGQKLGLVVLAALIGLAFYNDLARIF